MEQNINNFKNGTVFLLRNGKKYIKVDSVLIKLFNAEKQRLTVSYLFLTDYNKELKSTYEKEYDIIAYNNDISERCSAKALEEVFETDVPVWDWVREEDESIQDLVKDLKLVIIDPVYKRKLDKVLEHVKYEE